MTIKMNKPLTKKYLADKGWIPMYPEFNWNYWMKPIGTTIVFKNRFSGDEFEGKDGWVELYPYVRGEKTRPNKYLVKDLWDKYIMEKEIEVSCKVHPMNESMFKYKSAERFFGL
jgi:hypothetical protein